MPSKSKLKIEYCKIGTIKPWDRNPKLHNMQAIISSMDAFDITQPILVQKKSGRIIAGHGRLEAMKARGVVDVPVIMLDMTDEQAKAYALVDNQTVIAGGWDVALMGELLGEIKIELPDIDMADFGFIYQPVEIKEKEIEELETKCECPKCGYKW